MSATDKVVTNGQTLTRRMLAYIDASYAAAGLDPKTYRVVTQGSYKAGGGASASGSTHDGGGAADLRVWNLPRGMSAFSKAHPLVIELRRRGGAAWFRDANHGGFSDPHLHVILGPVGPEPALSSGASSQVADYRASRNGLSNKGSDYHDRPAQSAFVYDEPLPQPVPPDENEDAMIIVSPTGANYLLHGGHLCSLDGATGNNAASVGVPRFAATSASWDNMVRTYPVVPKP